VADYQQTAFTAIKEMYRQKGSTLVMNENNFAERGMIIRHLVLPGYVENSIKVLQDLAEISTSLTSSLMAQYWPTPAVKEHPSLGRKLQEAEYEVVRTELEKLGFYKGWVQDLESSDTYRPDFETDTPFR
jgi:putative pyruvate formate lyase activating enzyme